MENVISHRWRGCCYGVFAVTCVCLINTLVKTLETTSVHHYIFFRFLVGFLIVTVWISFKNMKLFRTKHLKSHIYRNSFAFTAIICHFIALHKLNLLDVSLIDKLSTILLPIGFNICFSLKVPWNKWIAIIAGFLVTIYSINPSFNLIHFEALIALGYPFGMVFFILILKTIKNDDHLTIVFYFFLLNILFSSFFIFFDTSISIELFPIIAIGILSVLAQIFLTKAYFYANPVHVNYISYFDIFIAAILGWVIWHEPVVFRKVIGSILVFCISGYILLKQEKQELELKSEPSS